MANAGRRPFTAELRRKTAVGGDAEAAVVAAPEEPSLQDMYDLMQTMAQDMAQLRQDVQRIEHTSTAQGGTLSPAPIPIAPSSDDRAFDEVATLKTELRALAYCIEQTKAEIANLRSNGNDEDHFATVATELDEVVNATEGATDRILDSCEAVEALSSALMAHVDDAYAKQVVDDIVEQTTKIFEACNFQDITGQRITKVVRTLQFIDQRIGSMLEIWGQEALVSMPGTDFQVYTQDDTVGLNGPQAGGEGISQAEIDKLFD